MLRLKTSCWKTTRFLPIIRGTVLLGTALLLGVGCQVGPDYIGPPTPKVQSSWSNPANEQNKSPNAAIHNELPALDDWWTVFNDPVLNELEEKLVAQNPSLAAAVARLDAAAAQIGIARASYAPSLDGSASVQYDRQTGEVRSSTKIANNPTWLPTRSLKTAASRR